MVVAPHHFIVYQLQLLFLLLGPSLPYFYLLPVLPIQHSARKRPSLFYISDILLDLINFLFVIFPTSFFLIAVALEKLSRVADRLLKLNLFL
jgi:hypothetical protein